MEAEGLDRLCLPGFTMVARSGGIGAHVVLHRGLGERMSCRRRPFPVFRTDCGTAQKQLSRADVVSLVRDGVLRRGVKVTHAPLQRRGLVDRAAAGQREARIGDADAGGGEPYRGLRALREQRLVLQRSGERMAPMARDLDPEKRPRRPQIGCDPAELELECFRLPHRPRPAAAAGRSRQAR